MMMKREEILHVYHQGPDVVVQLVSNMAARIQELEFRSKKTSKTVINHLQRMDS